MAKNQKNRCSWVGEDPLYISYHDLEWGVPVKDDYTNFEYLTLESAQAGLSWITVLRKRENYRKAFSQFNPEKVARFTESKVNRLMQNAGIIRNEKKIRAAINNAQRFLDLLDEVDSFYQYSLGFYSGKRLINKFTEMSDVPSQTAESQAMAKDLKRRGFKFLGPTTVYAHLQASGIVNDHCTDCFRHKPLSKK